MGICVLLRDTDQCFMSYPTTLTYMIRHLAEVRIRNNSEVRNADFSQGVN